MFTSSKLRILRTFSANDWNNPELYHSPSLIIALQIKTTSTLSSNAVHSGTGSDLNIPP